ncbi:hypothetical protein GCM10010365_45430 [Streptomyces poonensis]|uniref:Pyruvate, phosphate dikinase n=1 Tax=Streptomyces poonensis TaxID=68255 RepID=A0A918ULX6_9ACTN|nr:hypothetical protein GCM10010365_45430 [Streptomyces poonensis]
MSCRSERAYLEVRSRRLRPYWPTLSAERPSTCTLTAGRIAEEAQFFSFGTNDLTQTTWGFSRDDVEAEFFSAYLDRGVFPVSPFETLDIDGVGRLVRIAVAEGRAARPDLTIGVCGEHGGDPGSVHFFHTASLDYILRSATGTMRRCGM